MDILGHSQVAILVMKACSIPDDNMFCFRVMFHDLLEMRLGVIKGYSRKIAKHTIALGDL